MSETALALFLQALALVESGNNPRAVGAAGERGAFQMMPAVVASSGGYSERHAARHVRLLERELLHAQIEPTPFHLALAWNAGLGAVQRGAAPVRAYRHAARVENLFQTLCRGGLETGVPSLGSARADGLPRRSFTIPPASRSASAGVEPAPARGGVMLFALAGGAAARVATAP